MRLGKLQEFRYRDGPELRMKLPVRRRNVGQEDVSIRVRVQRHNARLEFAVRFQEAAALDLNWMGTQRPNPAKVQIEPEIDEGKRYRRRAGRTYHGRRGQLVFSHGPELRIAQAENAPRSVIRVRSLEKRHRAFKSGKGQNQRDPGLPSTPKIAKCNSISSRSPC